MIRARVDETIRKLDLVRRSDMEAVQELAANARAGQEAAEARLAELQATVSALEARVAALEAAARPAQVLPGAALKPPGRTRRSVRGGKQAFVTVLTCGVGLPRQ